MTNENVNPTNENVEDVPTHKFMNDSGNQVLGTERNNMKSQALRVLKALMEKVGFEYVDSKNAFVKKVLRSSTTSHYLYVVLDLKVTTTHPLDRAKRKSSSKKDKKETPKTPKVF